MKKKKGELPSGKVRYSAYLGKDASGKQIRKSFTADTMKEAKQQAAVWMLKHKTPTVTTLRSAITSYIDLRASVLSPATIRGYRAILRQLEDMPLIMLSFRLDAITPEEMQKFINDYSVSHSPKTVRNVFGLMAAAADRHGVSWRVQLPAKERPDLPVPDSGDVKEILCAFKGSELEIPILLGICGLRRSEICALRYPEDFTGNTVHVHRALVPGSDNQYHEKTTKTYHSDRFVVLPDNVISTIKKRGYITKLSPIQISHNFTRHSKSKGLPVFRFHSLRSFMVSYLHSQGVPDAYIQKAGGWSTDYVMKQVYRKTLQDQERDQQRKAAASIDALF